MTLEQPQTWEMRLLTWAQEAFDSDHHRGLVQSDNTALEAAYRHCAQITRAHSRTFYMASGLLPQQKQQAARALYAFSRITDDIVDAPGTAESRGDRLDLWRQMLAGHAVIDEKVCAAWWDAQARFDIPPGYMHQLIDGVARDLSKTRYDTFTEVAEYAYGVASTVGLMAMHIIGFAGDYALPYAIKLGVALQVTNILRDVAEDWHNGRVYLPQQEMAAFQVSEADLTAGIVNNRWREFMAFQIARARRLYQEARPGITLLDRDGRFAIAAAADLYEAILSDIEAHDYDVFSRRAHISKLGKLGRLPGIWWRSQRPTAHQVAAGK